MDTSKKQKEEQKEIGFLFFRYYNRFFFVMGYGEKKVNKQKLMILVNEYIKRNEYYERRGNPFYMSNPKKLPYDIKDNFKIIY